MFFATQSFAHSFASVKRILLCSLALILAACDQEAPPPLQYKEAHLEFIDFLKTITIAESDVKTKVNPIVSLRCASEPSHGPKSSGTRNTPKKYLTAKIQ
jgi:hypothetical protein